MRQRVDDLRAEIGRDVYELQSRVRETFDVQRQVSRHPFVAVVVFLGGVFVATRLVQSLVRGLRKTESRVSRLDRDPDDDTVSDALGRRAGRRGTNLKEARG